jgi:hypothetical protein
MMDLMKNGKYFLIIYLLIFLFYSCDNSSKIKLSKLEKKLEYNREDSVSLKLKDMGYACGECFPQYRIDSVLYSENGNFDFYLNKEIHLTFMEKGLKEEFNNLKCSGFCYDYYLSGIFRRNRMGIGKLEAISGRIIENKDCCNEDK